MIVAGPILARFVDQWVPKSADDLALFGAASKAGTRPGAAGPRRREPRGDRSERMPVTAASRSTPGDDGAARRRHSADSALTETGHPGEGRRASRASTGPTSRWRPGRKRVGFAPAIIGITLPVVLMLLDAITKLARHRRGGRRPQDAWTSSAPRSSPCSSRSSTATSRWGFGSGLNKSQVSDSVGSALPGIASIILIVAAGGGFKQTLIDAGVGNVIKDWAEGVSISVLVLGWLVAVLIRLGTGSATVATITAAGIVAPLAPTLSANHLALLVLAIGCGSLFFSHVNDAGFWLVKEYFGLTVGETIKSWSVMETVISVFGFALVMLVSVLVT